MKISLSLCFLLFVNQLASYGDDHRDSSGSKPRYVSTGESKISKNGSKFRRIGNTPLGEAWKSPDGTIWGDLVSGVDAKAKEVTFAEALEQCKKRGAELPTIEDFKKLAEFLGATPEVILGEKRYNPKGYVPQILPNLTRNENGKKQSLDFWSSTPTEHSTVTLGFGGLDGEVLFSQKESTMNFRCILRDTPDKKEEPKAPAQKAPAQSEPKKKPTKPVKLRYVDGIRKPFIIMEVLEERFRNNRPLDNNSALHLIDTFIDGTVSVSDDSDFQDAVLEDFRSILSVVGGWYRRKELFNSSAEESARKAFFLKLKSMNEKVYQDEAAAIGDMRKTLDAVTEIDRVIAKNLKAGALGADNLKLTALIVALVNSAVEK